MKALEEREKWERGEVDEEEEWWDEEAEWVEEKKPPKEKKSQNIHQKKSFDKPEKPRSRKENRDSKACINSNP